jgi:hypothetical protein
MKADRRDRQEMKPCRVGMADIRDREIKQANRHTGEADRKESHKKETHIIQRRRKVDIREE